MNANHLGIVPSCWEQISSASALLIAKRGLDGYAFLLNTLAEMDLFFARNQADTREKAIHKFILKELVKLYNFKDTDDLLNGRSHKHSMARMIGIYFFKENTTLSYSAIAILYRKKSGTSIQSAYKKMQEIKDAIGNTEHIRNFKTIETQVKIYNQYLANYERF